MSQEHIPSVDFIAIDFETATSDMDSACSVGIAVVSNLDVVHQFYSLIQPPNNKYDPKNIEIHGISPADTENSDPSWEVLS
ncbi:MAG: exonuclease domain-containing protein, partial [Elusimicrobiales bacterium]|nr:exonuclease domain-containing protein [Elusimicrobiales bacterium]